MVKHTTHRLKTFVANRVTQILAITTADAWFHISSENDPVDVASHGLFPEDLLQSFIWWHGPSAYKTLEEWPTPATPVISLTAPELRTEKRNSIWHIQKILKSNFL